jgi:hypothetical protein
MTSHKCDTLIQNNGFGGQAIHQEEGKILLSPCSHAHCRHGLQTWNPFLQCACEQGESKKYD